VFVLTLLSGFVYADRLKSAINYSIINDVNVNKDATWTAGVNANFEGASLQQVIRMLGWKKGTTKLPTEGYSLPPDAIPASFDSRTQWKSCSTISSIYNQAECGSCWAFGAVESISDRFCIKFGKNLPLSFMDMVTCDQNDNGCEGGDAESAYDYAKNSGLVTNECSPYTIPTCPPQDQPCLNFVNTPSCVQKCVNGTNTWTQDKHFMDTVYSVSSQVSAIQTEIMTNGPVEACFTVYEDFVGYKSGVYQHKSGDVLGGHCVKMLGWGTLSGTPYWLMANSWTTYWGANGFFLILRGSDECGIEDDIVAGIPSSHTTSPPPTTSSSSSSSTGGANEPVVDFF